MSNPNFIPTFSSDEVWRGTDTSRCISDDLDKIESDIVKLQENVGDDYAPADHKHDEYATVISLDEVKSELNGKADSNHSHETKDISDFPTSMKNPHSLSVKIGNVTNVYDGSADKTVDITPEAIGAAEKVHRHESFDEDVIFNAGVRFNITHPRDMYGQRFLNGSCAYASEGIDANTTMNENTLTHKNSPVSGQYYYIRTMFYNGKTTSNNRAQYAIPYSGNGSMYHRYFFDGKWTPWRRHANADEFGKVVEVVQMLAEKCNLNTDEMAMVSNLVEEFNQ